jgi:hypothetical protein
VVSLSEQEVIDCNVLGFRCVTDAVVDPNNRYRDTLYGLSYIQENGVAKTGDYAYAGVTQSCRNPKPPRAPNVQLNTYGYWPADEPTLFESVIPNTPFVGEWPAVGGGREGGCSR